MSIELVPGSVVAVRREPDERGEVEVRVTGAVRVPPGVEIDRATCRVVYWGGPRVLHTADAWISAEDVVDGTGIVAVEERLRGVLATQLTHLTVQATLQGRVDDGEVRWPTSTFDLDDGELRRRPAPTARVGACSIAAFAVHAYDRSVEVGAFVQAPDRAATVRALRLEVSALGADGIVTAAEDSQRDLEWGTDVAKLEVRVPRGVWDGAAEVRLRVGHAVRTASEVLRIPVAEIPETP